MLDGCTLGEVYDFRVLYEVFGVDRAGGKFLEAIRLHDISFGHVGLQNSPRRLVISMNKRLNDQACLADLCAACDML